MNKFLTQVGAGLRAFGAGQRLSSGLAAVVMLALSATPLHAAEEAASGTSNMLEEVLVTSQRRTERLLSVPVSVTALSEQNLVDLNASNFADYARSVPSLSFVSGAGQRGMLPVIRGITQLGGILPTTAIYMGETPVQTARFRITVIDPNLFDVARVEVLRGPQGDLYGSSSMGGAIKIVPNEPDPSGFDMSVDARLGTITDGGLTGAVNAMVNLPLAENAALRMVAMYGKDEGYIDQLLVSQLPQGPATSPLPKGRKDVDDSETKSVRIALKWDVTDKFSLMPSYHVQKEDFNSVNFVEGPLVPVYGSPVDVGYGLDEGTGIKFSIANLEAKYDFGWASLLSSTTKFKPTHTTDIGLTGLFAGLLGGLQVPTRASDKGEQDHFVQEVRLTSTTDWPVEFNVGLFYRDTSFALNQYIVNPALAFAFGPGGVFFIRENEDSKLKEKAAFVRLTWHITDQWEFSPGVRYSEYDVTTFIPTTQGLIGYPTLNERESSTYTSPSFALRYAVNDDLSLYARAANGYRPGYASKIAYPSTCFDELDQLGVNRNADAIIDPDALWNYELGVKGRFLDGRLTANLSAFRIDWTDLQLSLLLECKFALPSNAGKVKSEGVELEMAMLLSDNLTANVSFGYNEATLAEDALALGGHAGDRLPGVPKVTYSIGAQYDWQVAQYNMFARLDYAHTGDAYYKFVFNDAGRQPALGLVSGRLGIDVGDFQVALYGKNLLNEDKLNMCERAFATRNLTGYSTCTVRPRELGLQVRWTPNGFQ